MRRQERDELLSAVGRRFAMLAPYLTEQTRRVWAAAEASAIGAHGNTIVAQATGMSRTTIIKARGDLAHTGAPAERQRRPVPVYRLERMVKCGAVRSDRFPEETNA